MMSVIATPRDHWMRHARRWSRVGAPLRPPPSDVAVCRDAVTAWHARSDVATPRALVLGVTPELVAMDWPARTRVLSLDLSLPMIQGVWPGPRTRHAAACADWLHLPLATDSQDVIVGDGCFNVLPSGGLYSLLSASLRDVLRDDGLLVMRLFVHPDAAESPDAVCDALHAGQIGNFHVFKWRLAMAMQSKLSTGVQLAAIWDAWHRGVPEPRALMSRLGWPAEVVETIDGYRDVDTCYTFPTLDEVRSVLSSHFHDSEIHTPDYELGTRCPTLILRPR